MKSLLVCTLALGVLAIAPPASAQQDDTATHDNKPADKAKTPDAMSNRDTTPNRDKTGKPMPPAHPGTVTTRDRTVTTTHPPDATSDVHRNVTTTVHRTVDVTRYRKVVRAPQRFHAAPWVAPRGFTYRRFSLGERVPSVLLAADFFLASYALYGLDAPPDGYVWVRDGSDAVLVDQETGEVIQVEYDVFY